LDAHILPFAAMSFGSPDHSPWLSEFASTKNRTISSIKANVTEHPIYHHLLYLWAVVKEGSPPRDSEGLLGAAAEYWIKSLVSSGTGSRGHYSQRSGRHWQFEKVKDVDFPSLYF
jgi:hypothetical protein